MARNIPQEVRDYFDEVFGPATRSGVGDDWLGTVVTAMDDVSTLAVASQLLRERNLHHSAQTWGNLKIARLEPALERGDITRAGILEMLQEMEEHGRSHILLFKPKSTFKVSGLLKERRVQTALESKVTTICNSMPSPKAPAKLTITHVRFEPSGALVVKALETKEIHRSVHEVSLQGGRLVRFAERVRIRRVKLARLHTSGLLEVRLGSNAAVAGGRNTHRYTDEAVAFLQHLGSLIPESWFEPVSIDGFKSSLWRRRAGTGVEERIQVVSQNLATDKGNSMALRAGSRRKDASQDEALREASESVLARAGSLSQAKILWREQQAPLLPSAEFTIRVTDEINEFYTTKAATKADYESVFSDIRQLGRL